MSGQLADRSAVASEFRPGTIRQSAWALLFLVEVFAFAGTLSGEFSTPSAAWWCWPIVHASVILQILAVLAGAVLLLAGVDRLKQTLSELVGVASNRRWATIASVHAASFAALLFVNVCVCSRGVLESEASGLWAASWLGLIALTGGTAALLMAPWHFWQRLLWRERRAILLGMAVGIGAWCLGRWTRSYWIPLSSTTFFSAEWLLRLLYPDVIANPAARELGTPAFAVTINDQCSGYEGVGLISVFLAAYCWVFRDSLRFPHVWLLWPVGMIVMWTCNVLRITALIALGSSYSPDIAVGGFHSQAGWIALIATSLCLGGGALRSPFFANRPAPAAARRVRVAASAYLVPFLVMMAVQMVAAAFSTGFDRWYPVKAIALALACAAYAEIYRRTEWSLSWAAVINGTVVFALWIALSPANAAAGDALRTAVGALTPLSATGWLVCRVIGSVVLVPLVEEFAFRGYLMRRLSATDFENVPYAQCTWKSIGVSSLLFGLLHGQWLAGTVAGVLFSLAARRRGKLCDAVVAHAIANALIAADVLMYGSWWLW